MSEIITCRTCGTKYDASGSCPRCTYYARRHKQTYRIPPEQILTDETLSGLLRPKKPVTRAAEPYDFQDYAAVRKQAKIDHRPAPSYGEWQAKKDGLL